MKKRVFMYLRVSEPSLLNTQEKVLKEYCRQNDWEVVKVFSDNGFSGKNMDRPALKEMLEAIKRKEADIVLVDTIDRLSRSGRDALHLIKNVFTPNNVAFVAIADHFDTSTFEGRVKLSVLEAEYESTTKFIEHVTTIRGRELISALEEDYEDSGKQEGAGKMIPKWKTITKTITIDVDFYEDFMPPDKFEELTEKNHYKSNCDNCPFFEWDDDTGFNDCIIGGDDKCPIKQFF